MNPIKVQELGHLVLYVKDIKVSAHFYKQVLGWDRLKTPEHFPIAAFSSGRTHHELLLIEVGSKADPVHRGHRLGLYHFGLKIGDSDDDLRTAITHLERHQIPILGLSDHTVSHSLYIEDPDGNEIELYIDVPGIDWKNNPELVLAPTRPLSL